MLFRLFLLFTLLPLAEFMLLVWLADQTSFLFTLGLVILTGIVGAWLARLEGLRTLWRLRTDLARGRMPADALFDGVLILLAGAVLITPGVLTDVFGFSLLFPPLRSIMKRWLKRRYGGRFQVYRTSAGGESEVIDARIVEKD